MHDKLRTHVPSVCFLPSVEPLPLRVLPNVVEERVPKETIHGINYYFKEQKNERVPIFFWGIGTWIDSLFQE